MKRGARGKQMRTGMDTKVCPKKSEEVTAWET
jgi:hypothetical protein